MSLIAHVLIYTGSWETDGINKLNSWMKNFDTERHQQFASINMDEAGGTKAFTTDIYAAALNHFDWQTMVDYIRDEIEWEAPESVVVIIDYEDLPLKIFQPGD